LNLKDQLTQSVFNRISAVAHYSEHGLTISPTKNTEMAVNEIWPEIEKLQLALADMVHLAEDSVELTEGDRMRIDRALLVLGKDPLSGD